MSSYSEQSQKRWIKKGNKAVLHSIPAEKSNVPSNISVFTIGTNTSPILMTRLPQRHPTKAKNKQKLANADEQKPAKKKTKGRKNLKMKRSKKLADTDSDWTTTLEPTDDEKENSKQPLRSSTKEPALFYDTTSPEVVREPQHIRDYQFDSPIRQPRKDAASPVRIDFGDNEKFLHEKDLPHFQTRFDSSDEEEHEPVFIKSDLCRTTVDARHRRKTKKIRDWVASSAKAQEELSSSEDSSNRKQNKGDKVIKLNKAAEEGNVEKWATKKLWFSRDAKAESGRKRGYCDDSRKWFKNCLDPYKFPVPDDPDFERTETRAPKVRLNEYLEKCRVQKYLDPQAAGPSCSKYERITKENIKDKKSEEKEKLQTRKPVVVDLVSDSSSDSETANMPLVKRLATELQRIHNLRSYATLLKKLEMRSENVTKDSSVKSSTPRKRKTRKRANELNRDDSKKTKMVDR